MDSEQIRVMLVEDQEIARLGLRLVLEQNSVITIAAEAEDGPLAVEKALAMVPDVVLMDIGLPGFDGIEATKRIKEQDKSIKIMMMTSHDHAEDVFAALSAGADGYILKETSVELIAAAVSIVVKGGVYLDSRIASLLVSQPKPPNQKASGGFANAAKAPDPQFGLSSRELEVLELVVQGFSNPEMAERLFISNETVKTHMRHIMEKLMVSDRTQAAIKALRSGVIVPGDSAKQQT